MFIFLEEAKKSPEDAKKVMEWRNDPTTLSMSFRGSPKQWPDFLDEYIREYFPDVPVPPHFALYQGESAVFLKIKKNQNHSSHGSFDIDINVNPKLRGKGIGTLAIKKFSELVFQKPEVERLIAEIKIENKASIRAFQKAGFHFLEEATTTVAGENCRIYRFCRDAKATAGSYPFFERPVYIIAEAGSNWRMGTRERDLQMAKTLVDVAVEAGANAVKFQTYRPESVYVSNAGQAEYLKKSGIKQDISSIFKDLSMPYDMLPELSDYCKRNKIDFMSTPFSVQDAKEVDPFVQLHKVASYEIAHVRLVEYLAQTGKPVVMSTGASSLEEVEWAVNWFFRCGGKDLSLMQCTAKYPATYESLNLNVISSYIKHFGLRVGFSDHSRDPSLAPVAAVSLGARIIEKHYTLDNRLPGPDHPHAITAEELKVLVRDIRNAEKCLGSGLKRVDATEDELKSFAKRSLQAIKPISVGESLKEGLNFEVLRPGSQIAGAHPKFLFELEGKKARRSLGIGEGIFPHDFE